jgi:hypothetical protein
VAQPNDETPPQHSLRTCMQEAETFLREAESELDGTEHPAIYDLVHACKWLMAGLEALEAASKPKGDPP